MTTDSISSVPERGAPSRLRVEHLEEPLGIDVARPRLSWILPAGSQRQIAYRIKAGDWDSGRVESDRTVLVPYEGPANAAGAITGWKVKVWTDLGESDWSTQGRWEAGLSPGDWIARWVEPDPGGDLDGSIADPAYLLRSEFDLDRRPRRARAYATAHGLYELYLNGERVGTSELTPGCTAYRSHLLYQTYDVTELLREGTNVVGAVLSGGWFRSQAAIDPARVLGGRLGLLAQINIYDGDGAFTPIVTGDGWTWAGSAIRSVDLKRGQEVDARLGPPDLVLNRSDGTWRPVAVRDYDLARLRSSPAPPVRRIEELRPVEVRRVSEEAHVVDLGQNINGWMKLGNLGPAGTEVRLIHGEVLDEDGTVSQKNILQPPDYVFERIEKGELPAEVAVTDPSFQFQVDRIVAAGVPDETFEPRHTTHGFRYVEVEGIRHDLTPEDLRGVVVHTDLRRTGWFSCSDDRLNRLHEIGTWTFRGNACDIPTDCPQRERLGWTGDWQVYSPTAALMYDVAGLSAKWLRDLAVLQLPNGGVQHVAPLNSDFMMGDPLVPSGSAGWGDAAVIVPWEMWRAYGDERILAEQWPSMVAWVEYAARAARWRRHRDRAEARPTPAPHEVYLWDSGFHWGDWLENGGDPYEPFRPGFSERDRGYFATAYFYRSASLLAKIAAVLDRRPEEEHYRGLSDAIHGAWQAEYVGDDGTLTVETQANYVRALAFDLIPAEARDVAVERLIELIREAGNHVHTGYLATSQILPVLVECGHPDIAFDLLLQEEAPSWLSMIERGATTIWETFDAVDEHGRAKAASLNHTNLGVVGSFLYNYIGGLRLDEEVPAYGRFRVQPIHGGNIDWAETKHLSPSGDIGVEWHMEDRAVTLEVEVPPGTEADVCLPDGACLRAGVGKSAYRYRI